MADQEHLDILMRGVEVWNEWRKGHPNIRPDFSHADLSETYPSNFARANFSEAIFNRANLSEVNLEGADFSWANLRRTNFSRTNLRHAKFGRATVGWTIFADVDLSTVRELDKVDHMGPSTIGLDTILRSRGNIPEIFLQRVGTSAVFISYIRSLVNNPIEYYTCLISYSSKDQEFAERLYADLQARGVRCWFAPEDLKIGDKIRHRIDESIRLYDKLLLVLSEDSTMSEWVEYEVETALNKERPGKPPVLFPIRLDKAVMQSTTAWAAHIKRTRHIGNFECWEDHREYKKAFDRLLRDLKAGE
ncbi:MAG: toll/interleukin-1 receptor domain-containing protein [Chloroflexota bacterium]|nr:toll/interleukin-1 receptor domain-containing protein [Chloroflexota bacterium]